MSQRCSTEPRETLLREIITHGITHGTPDNPIVSRDGRLGTSWVMSFLGVGLREPWLSRACDLLLETVEEFDAGQLATMGSAASSLLAGSVLRSGGHYNGLLVRPEPKAYGSAKQIEGLGDHDVPVVIIDDAIGTGHSALKCAEILEANGYEVAGVVALVRFTYDSGFGLVEERGLPVRAVFDLYEDITPILEPECTPHPTPWRAKDIQWQNKSAPERLTPFAFARLCFSEIAQTGTLPRPPEKFAVELNTPGGVWVSLRKFQNGTPLARAGVWRFPDEPEATAPTLLAEACWSLSQLFDVGQLALDEIGIGLSLIGELTPILPGEANNETHGLVCRSRERPWKVGSALPRMPGFHGTAHQLRHAVFTNGQLRPLEPFDLYACTVTKLIEAGAHWPEGGCSAPTVCAKPERDAAASAMLLQARTRLQSQWSDHTEAGGRPLPSEQAGDTHLMLAGTYLFVSLIADDQLLACVGRQCAKPADFGDLVDFAASDTRLTAWRARNTADAVPDIQLSCLSAPWHEKTPPPFIVGRNAMAVTVQGQMTVLLPGVGIDDNLDAQGFLARLIDKAGVGTGHTSAVSHYTRFEVETWSLLGTRPVALQDAGSTTVETSPAPAHASNWVQTRQVVGQPLRDTALGWWQWLRDHVCLGSLADHELPVQLQLGAPASPALYAEAVRRLCEAAIGLGQSRDPLPLDLLPRRADLLTLAHATAAAAASAQQTDDNTLLLRLRERMRHANPRHDAIAFWRASEICPVDEPYANRWRDAPLPPLARIIRLTATRDPEEMNWLRGLVSECGTVHASERAAEDTLIAARAAEALAGSPAHNDRAAAKRILDHLQDQSVNLGNGRAAIRASQLQTGLRTEHTVAALAAFTRLHADPTA